MRDVGLESGRKGLGGFAGGRSGGCCGKGLGRKHGIGMGVVGVGMMVMMIVIMSFRGVYADFEKGTQRSLKI